MSAIQGEKHQVSNNKTQQKFYQKIPIQSYLIAIAIGALESREISQRCRVWSEKELLDKAQYEFSNTEKQLQVAEEICGPYVWGIYHLLVLPPSFPFGGMENPCLTFVTPTLLAGDRSLANLVAHEIAHSWTGNLVTNKNFEHFWLNEGFTVFIERRIIGRLEGKEMEDFQALNGVEELKETVNDLGKKSNLTSLVVNLKNKIHPDDAFSSVPYEKGSLFLRYIENIVGGPEKFEPFLRKYFETYKYKSLTTDEFVSFFKSEFSETKDIEDIDWNTWLYAPGMPPTIPTYNQNYAFECDKFIKNVIDNFNISEENISSLTSEQKIYILQKLLEVNPLPIEKLEKLEELLQLNNVENSELKFRWLRISLKSHWSKKIEPALKWVTDIGRMKFIRPIYKDLYGWELSREEAIENFQENRKKMMHVAAYTIAQDLHLN